MIFSYFFFVIKMYLPTYKASSTRYEEVVSSRMVNGKRHILSVTVIIKCYLIILRCYQFYAIYFLYKNVGHICGGLETGHK